MDGFHCDGSQRPGLLKALLGPFWPIQVGGFHCDGLHMHATYIGSCMVICCDALLQSQLLDLQIGYFALHSEPCSCAALLMECVMRYAAAVACV